MIHTYIEKKKKEKQSSFHSECSEGLYAKTLIVVVFSSVFDEVI